MIATRTRADCTDTSGLVGVRTRGSDLVRWAVWTGDDPPALYQWVRMLDTGELGRIAVAPGQAVGVYETNSLPRVSAVDDGDKDSDLDDMVRAPAPGAWGRIGNHIGPVKSVATEEMESPESIKYRLLKADMPALGGRITTHHGSGVVIALDVFKGRVSVRLDMSSDVVEIQHRSLPLSGENGAPSGSAADDPSA